MKSIIISLIVIVSNLQILSQESLGWMEFEIFMMTANLPSGDTIRYKMEAFGTVWHTTNFSNYYTTTDYNIAYYPPITDPPTGNTDWTDQASVYGSTYGFNFIPSGSFWDYGNYAYGLYKVNSNYSDQYFYVDYRDDRYPQNSSYVTAPGGVDIWILYNKTGNIFKYSREGLYSPTDTNWITINKGAYLSIWQIKGVGTPTTNKFPNFWQNCLSVVNDGNNQPRLVWGPIPNHTYYIMFRKYGASAWEAIDTVDQTTYVDEDVYLVQPGGQAGTNVKYKVAPLNLPTSFTNEVMVTVVGMEIEKRIAEAKKVD